MSTRRITRRSLWQFAGFFLAMGLVGTGILLFVCGDDLWASHPNWRFFTVHLIDYRSLKGTDWPGVFQRLGPADETKHLVSLKIRGTPDSAGGISTLDFRLDMSNRVVSASSSVTNGTEPFSLEHWYSSGGKERAGMLPDFVRQCNEGKLRGRFDRRGHIAQLIVPGQVQVSLDVWRSRYFLNMPRNKFQMSMETLHVNFDTNGYVKQIRIVHE
jgi:hypothetical protein